MYKDNTTASFKIFIYPQSPRSVKVLNHEIQRNVISDVRTRFFLRSSKEFSGREMIKMIKSRDHWIFYFWSDFFPWIKILIFYDILCLGSYQTGDDLIFFAFDHIKLVVIQIFCLGRDHVDFDDMIFFDPIQWSMIFCVDPCFYLVYLNYNFYLSPRLLSWWTGYHRQSLH